MSTHPSPRKSNCTVTRVAEYVMDYKRLMRIVSIEDIADEIMKEVFLRGIRNRSFHFRCERMIKGESMKWDDAMKKSSSPSL